MSPTNFVVFSARMENEDSRPGLWLADPLPSLCFRANQECHRHQKIVDILFVGIFAFWTHISVQMKYQFIQI